MNPAHLAVPVPEDDDLYNELMDLLSFAYDREIEVDPPVKFDGLQRQVAEMNFTPCWIWPGRLQDNGYPSLWNDYDDHPRMAYAAMFELIIGRSPRTGKELDHLCRVPSCVNPAHLEEVTKQENLRRKSDNAFLDKGSCGAGHRLTPANMMIRQDDGRRLCRMCEAKRRSEPGREVAEPERPRSRKPALNRTERRQMRVQPRDTPLQARRKAEVSDVIARRIGQSCNLGHLYRDASDLWVDAHKRVYCRTCQLDQRAGRKPPASESRRAALAMEKHLEALHRAYGERSFTAREIAERYTTGNLEPIEPLFPATASSLMLATRWRRAAGAQFGSLSIVKQGSDNGTVLWQVVRSDL